MREIRAGEVRYDLLDRSSLRDEIEALGAELQGFEPLASNRRFAAWGRRCGETPGTPRP